MTYWSAIACGCSRFAMRVATSASHAGLMGVQRSTHGSGWTPKAGVDRPPFLHRPAIRLKGIVGGTTPRSVSSPATRERNCTHPSAIAAPGDHQALIHRVAHELTQAGWKLHTVIPIAAQSQSQTAPSLASCAARAADPLRRSHPSRHLHPSTPEPTPSPSQRLARASPHRRSHPDCPTGARRGRRRLRSP